MGKPEEKYVRGILATSSQVRGVVIHPDALRHGAEEINARTRKMPILVDHDYTCPPVGITLGARLVKLENGVDAIEAFSTLFDPPIACTLPSGEEGLCQYSSEHPFPILSGDFSDLEEMEISIDPTNFGGHEKAKKFLDDIQESKDLFKTCLKERRGWLPDPEIVFSLGAKASIGWFGVRVGKAAADALEPRLKLFFEAIYRTIEKSALSAIPFNRPITYILKVNGTPNLEFVARTRNSGLVIRAMAGDFSQLTPEITALKERFDAELIQYLLNEEGNWELNFLLSSDGKVVGKRIAFDRRTMLLSRVDQSSKRKKRIELRKKLRERAESPKNR